MIVEIVSFNLPAGTGRAEALALYRQTAGKWVVNPDLIQKFYMYDQERGVGGGVYFWRSREAIALWHGDDYRAMVRELYGAEPRIEIFEVAMHVEPGAAKISEY
jgi:hypothetical protein